MAIVKGTYIVAVVGDCSGEINVISKPEEENPLVEIEEVSLIFKNASGEVDENFTGTLTFTEDCYNAHLLVEYNGTTIFDDDVSLNKVNDITKAEGSKEVNCPENDGTLTVHYFLECCLSCLEDDIILPEEEPEPEPEPEVTTEEEEPNCCLCMEIIPSETECFFNCKVNFLHQVCNCGNSDIKKLAFNNNIEGIDPTIIKSNNENYVGQLLSRISLSPDECVEFELEYETDELTQTDGLDCFGDALIRANYVGTISGTCLEPEGIDLLTDTICYDKDEGLTATTEERVQITIKNAEYTAEKESSLIFEEPNTVKVKNTISITNTSNVMIEEFEISDTITEECVTRSEDPCSLQRSSETPGVDILKEDGIPIPVSETETFTITNVDVGETKTVTYYLIYNGLCGTTCNQRFINNSAEIIGKKKFVRENIFIVNGIETKEEITIIKNLDPQTVTSSIELEIPKENWADVNKLKELYANPDKRSVFDETLNKADRRTRNAVASYHRRERLEGVVDGVNKEFCLKEGILFDGFNFNSVPDPGDIRVCFVQDSSTLPNECCEDMPSWCCDCGETCECSEEVCVECVVPCGCGDRSKIILEQAPEPGQVPVADYWTSKLIYDDYEIVSDISNEFAMHYMNKKISDETPYYSITEAGVRSWLSRTDHEKEALKIIDENIRKRSITNVIKHKEYNYYE